uniref:Uncharacterized protein n=1 Tax=Pseudoalteromonas citrea DSM 8771 TaxID=1117314 RepID=U1KRN0_9GAMM
MSEEKLSISKLDKTIFKSIIMCTALTTISIISIILGWFGVFKPNTEGLDVWFQRSGSITVVFALLCEFKLFPVNNSLYISRIHFNDFSQLKEKYGLLHNILSMIALILMILGTIIWGYGDLLR